MTDGKSSKVYALSVDNLDDTGKPGITLVIKNLPKGKFYGTSNQH